MADQTYTDADKRAAHDFLSELRTRIAVQPLPYQSGVEARALESLWELFALARKAMKDNPGCAAFAHYVSDMLNVQLRPVTAKWHRAHAEGRLDSRDGSDEFRGDLATVREALVKAADHLHRMAYGTPFADEPSPGPMTQAGIDACLAPVAYGIFEPRPLIKQGAGLAAVDVINSRERQDIDTRRGRYGIANRPNVEQGRNAIGLALSGGGIRSATFCLGAIQVLAHKKLLKDVDYLSTVSGGGYTGSFLTTRLTGPTSQDDVAAPGGPDPLPVRYLRQHAKYLAANDLWQAWGMVISTLAGMVLNWTAPLCAIAIAAFLFLLHPALPPPWSDIVTWSHTILGLALVSGVALLAYGWELREKGTAKASGWVLGISVALMIACAGAWIITLGYQGWEYLRSPGSPSAWHIVLIAVGAVSTAMPAIMRFVPILQKPAVQQTVLKGALVLAGLIVPLGAIVLFYVFLDLGFDRRWALATLAAALAIVAFIVLDINRTGPHRLYRDQLAATFVHLNENDVAPKPLSTINQAGFAPYHLINTTVNLPTSAAPTLRERKSDFFLFSKRFSGAPSVGYRETTAWKLGGAEVDLASAMAISGAAFSSNMGLASMPPLRALLTFLNVRLGVWINRPETGGGRPGFGCLMREMLGLGMSENDKWLNLSDGGHIENMAVYELLRRRCKFILSIDGEADPGSAFHGHLTLVRHAQIDFGVRIDSTLADLRPDTVSKFSKTHYMFCRIHYPPRAPGGEAEIGLLLYVKLSVTGNEEELIKRYRLNHPDFPHQTTLDQFFDEEQFEAYRELGAHVMGGLFSRAITNGQTVATIPDWFRELATNLLEPA